MLLDLHYSVTINEAKEKFRIVFCCFSAILNIVAPSFSSNFPTNQFVKEYSYLFVVINIYQ